MKLSNGHARGFSLVELVTVVAISGVVMVSSVTALSHMTETGQSMASKSNGQMLAREIQQVTDDPTTCMKSIGGLDFKPATDARLALSLDSAGRSISKGLTLQSDGIAVKDFYLEHVRPLGILGTHTKPMYAADMVLDLQRTDGKSAMKAQRAGRLYLEVDGARVVACSSRSDLPNLLSATCLQMGGTYASGTCDMSPYANAIVKKARDHVDAYLKGDYNRARTSEIAGNVKIAMDSVSLRGKDATAAYTKARMEAVTLNLNSNLTTVNGSIDGLNRAIANSVSTLTGQANGASANAASVYGQALSAYTNALGTYSAAQQANGLATATGNNVISAAGISAVALDSSLGARATSNGSSDFSYAGMIAAIGAASTADSALTGANAAVNWARANVDYAGNVNTFANNVNSYAQSSHSTANGAAAAAGSARDQAANAISIAQSATTRAAYAAGIASMASADAIYAYNHPPTITQNVTTTVTFTPCQACSDSEAIAVIRSSIRRIEASEDAVANACVDDQNTAADSHPINEAQAVRYLNTCGNRYCQTQGAVSGRVVEDEPGRAYLDCRFDQVRPAVSAACQTRVQQLPRAVDMLTVPSSLVAEHCVDNMSTNLADQYPTTPNATVRWMFTCGNRECRSRGYSAGRGVEVSPAITVLECSNEEVFNQLGAGTMVREITTTPLGIGAACMDGPYTTPEQSLPNGDARQQMRFVNTCGNRFCHSQGFASGRVTEHDGSIAIAMCQM